MKITEEDRGRRLYRLNARGVGEGADFAGRTLGPASIRHKETMVLGKEKKNGAILRPARKRCAEGDSGWYLSNRRSNKMQIGQAYIRGKLAGKRKGGRKATTPSKKKEFKGIAGKEKRTGWINCLQNRQCRSAEGKQGWGTGITRKPRLITVGKKRSARVQIKKACQQLLGPQKEGKARAEQRKKRSLASEGREGWVNSAEGSALHR